MSLEGGDSDRVSAANRDRRLPDNRKAEEGSGDHLQGRALHHHGRGGAVEVPVQEPEEQCKPGRKK